MSATTSAPKGADIERYRPGFEEYANSRHLGFERARITSQTDYARSETNEAWHAWIAARSSTSTSQGAARPKDCDVRQLINDLCNIAVTFHATSQLRDRIAGAVGQLISTGNSGAAPGDALDAARWRFFDAEAQSHIDGGTLAEWLAFDAVMQHGSRNAAIDLVRSAIAASTTQQEKK